VWLSVGSEVQIVCSWIPFLTHLWKQITFNYVTYSESTSTGCSTVVIELLLVGSFDAVSWAAGKASSL